MHRLIKIISKYEHVIWDWNGTILNDAEQSLIALNKLLLEHNLDEIKLWDYKSKFCHPLRNFYKDLGFDLEKNDFNELCTAFLLKYHNQREYMKVQKGIMNVIKYIDDSEITQIILSAMNENILIEDVRRLGLINCFEHVLGLNIDDSGSKISRAINFINMNDYALSKTLIIGDTDHDLDVANELSIDIVFLANGHQSFEKLSSIKNKRIIDVIYYT